MLHKKHFTVESARLILDSVIEKLTRILELKIDLTASGYDIYKHQYFGGAGPNGTGQFPKDMEELVLLVKDIFDEGIIIKDIDTGLIDFPHINKNGVEVYLCYRLGESGIKYWHHIKDGIAGRKPLKE